MITYYRVRGSLSWLPSAEIVPLEFAKETDKFLVQTNGQRVAKKSEYYNYFKTHVEAKEYLQNMTALRIKDVKDNLAQAQQLAAAINKL